VHAPLRGQAPQVAGMPDRSKILVGGAIAKLGARRLHLFVANC
jgi:hypothetical protein